MPRYSKDSVIKRLRMEVGLHCSVGSELNPVDLILSENAFLVLILFISIARFHHRCDLIVLFIVCKLICQLTCLHD